MKVFSSTVKNLQKTLLKRLKIFNKRLNIARGTTDPELDSVTLIELGNNMALLALIANLATRWHHLG